MGWVIQGEIAKLNHGLKHSEKFVLLTFASFALDDGSSCYPAISTVARRTILSERTVRRVVAKFVRNGVMIVKGKQGNLQFKYQIDIERANALHYKPDGEDGPGSPETESGQATDSHDTLSRLATNSHDTLSRLATNSHDTLSDSHDTVSDSYDTLSGNPVKDPIENPSVASPRKAGARDPEAAPACAVWNANKDRLIERLGANAWKAWLCTCIPDTDDGSELTLAVPTAFMRDYVVGNFLTGIEKIVERKVTLVVRPWAGQAGRDRQRREEEEGADA